MSDSDSDGGPGLEDFMWGNLGEGDRLEVDYMPQVTQQNALCALELVDLCSVSSHPIGHPASL